MDNFNMRKWFRNQYITEAETMEVEAGEVLIGDYQTKHFDVCPGAQSLYKRIVDEKLVNDMDLVERSTKLHDALFAIEFYVLHLIPSFFP